MHSNNSANDANNADDMDTAFDSVAFAGGIHVDVQTDARECLRWIEVNNTALRKILKKWDKTNHSTMGRAQLRKYWSDSKYQVGLSPGRYCPPRHHLTVVH